MGTVQLDIDLFVDWYYGTFDLYEQVRNIGEIIAHFDFHNWKDELNFLFQDLMTIIGDIIPCFFDYNTIASIINLIIHPSIKALEYHILTNLSMWAQTIFNDLIEILTSLFKLDFYTIGFDISQIAYLLIR